MNPKVTVLMPVRNGAEFLRPSINSILTQTFSDFELLVVFDESKDRSLQILTQLANQDSRIRILNLGNSGGLPQALNAGIAQSRGTYIARMDSDDVATTRRLECQVAFMESHRDVIAVGMDAICFEKSREFISFPKDHESLTARLRRSTCFVHPTVMMRKDLLINNGLFYNPEMKFCEDWEFWVRLSKVGKLANIHRVGLLYRVHAQSVSAENQKKLDFYNQKILKELPKSNRPESNEARFEFELGQCREYLKKGMRLRVCLSAMNALRVAPLLALLGFLRKIYYRLLGPVYVTYWLRKTQS